VKEMSFKSGVKHDAGSRAYVHVQAIMSLESLRLHTHAR